MRTKPRFAASSRPRHRYNGGELKCILINLGTEPFEIRRGDRIAQLVVAPVQTGRMVEVTELDETVRGAGGFGSTGVRIA